MLGGLQPPHHTHTHIRCSEDYSQWNCFLLCWNICLIFQGEHLTQQQIAGNWNNFISVTSHERYCVSITGDWTICSIFAHADNIKSSPSTAIVRNLPMANRFPSQRARNAESVCMSWPLHKYIVGTSAYTIIRKSRKYSISNFDWQKSSMIRQCEVRGKAFIMIEKDIDWSEYCRRILLKNKRAIETDFYKVFVSWFSTQTGLQYIPRNMHTVFALLCFVVVIHWLIFPYPPGLLHWHCGNLTIAPVPAKQPWWIWINISCELIMNDCITTTKQNTTKPCAYFLGYTVCETLVIKDFYCLISVSW